MKTNDLKIIVEMLGLCKSPFDRVKLEKGTIYATNSVSLVERQIELPESGFVQVKSLPILKALWTANKKEEEVPFEFLKDHLIQDANNFPSTEILSDAYDRDFKFEIRIDAKQIVEILKSVKSKNNQIILKIESEKSPVCFVHDNGKGLIQPVSL